MEPTPKRIALDSVSRNNVLLEDRVMAPMRG